MVLILSFLDIIYIYLLYISWEKNCSHQGIKNLLLGGARWNFSLLFSMPIHVPLPGLLKKRLKRAS
ncbi:hypothetical protein QBC43DRAFT_308400 [Cladorrhinum sp. PSN259]|nr:hypothetical protein QBC43DRAFT_308400 [Cladorrhinum sp. PSN259]